MTSPKPPSWRRTEICFSKSGSSLPPLHAAPKENAGINTFPSARLNGSSSCFYRCPRLCASTVLSDSLPLITECTAGKTKDPSSTNPAGCTQEQEQVKTPRQALGRPGVHQRRAGLAHLESAVSVFLLCECLWEGDVGDTTRPRLVRSPHLRNSTALKEREK